IDVMFDQPQQIDLLSLQAGRTEFLLENIRVPAGKYNWIRLHVNAIRDFDFDSYIELNDGQQHELDIPSGDERGLQIIHDIEVEANGSVNFVIDFDLRKSIVEAGGNYSLKPVLRIADLNNTGSLTGIADTTISSTVLNAAANCLDGGMAVYVFEGADTVTDDIDGDSGDPVASANVVLNGSGEYEYVVSFLEPGLYTVGLTCDADLDQADTDDVITFVAIENVNIVSQRETIKVLR
ncbi:MAG: DUF4382 domain-containing protein, partial [Gammaproteobacteria bacterium]|nr:DUF4382 domain-containing protein [Gammaproteobacteria bacterium]